MTVRVLVCGGRDYADEAHVYTVLDAFHAEQPVDVIIAGGKLESEDQEELARGADRHGLTWAVSRGVTPLEEPAEWRRYGNRAGPIRNSAMISKHRPTHIAPFPGGRGTADMVKKAARAKLQFITT